jgi:hypothetical protein
MPNLAAKYSSEYLSPDRMRTALLQLPPILEELLGEYTLTVQYGIGTRLHGSLQYIPMSVSCDMLPFFLADSLEQQIVLPGASDVLIASTNNELSLLFCHESDIHVDGSDKTLMQRFIASSPLSDIKFLSQAQLMVDE